VLLRKIRREIGTTTRKERKAAEGRGGKLQQFQGQKKGADESKAKRRLHQEKKKAKRLEKSGELLSVRKEEIGLNSLEGLTTSPQKRG